jgi:hypothetical protein
VGPGASLDVVAKRRTSYTCQESNPGCPACSLVTILTELIPWASVLELGDVILSNHGKVRISVLLAIVNIFIIIIIKFIYLFSCLERTYYSRTHFVYMKFVGHNLRDFHWCCVVRC